MDINTPNNKPLQTPPSMKTGKVGKAFLVYVVVLAGIIGLLVFLSRNGQDTATQNPMTDGTSAPIESINNSGNGSSTDTSGNTASGNGNSTGQSTYKDGTYTAVGSYMSPGGKDSVTVSLTLKNDIVVDSSVTNGANDSTSSRYQNFFISGYKQYVTGKKISDIHLDVVSGSSLTSRGFNEAVTNIEAQAKA